MPAEDRILIEETLNGNLGSYDLLMQRYQNLVYRIVYPFGRNKDNALDITQNTFLKVFQNLRSYEGRSSFKTWLSQIAYNEGINWQRKMKNTNWDEPIELDHHFSTNEPSSEDEMLAMEFRRTLLRSLFALNTKYRLAVVLRYYQNMPIKEIAAVIQCSEAVVKNMLYRSLQRLKKILTEEQRET